MQSRFVADQRRVALIRLVRRQHVVVGSDHADVRPLLRHHAQLVALRQGGECMRHVGAAHARRAGRALRQPGDTRQIGLAHARATFANARSDFKNGGLHARSPAVTKAMIIR
jgi:hypothetical protein